MAFDSDLILPVFGVLEYRRFIGKNFLAIFSQVRRTRIEKGAAAHLQRGDMIADHFRRGHDNMRFAGKRRIVLDQIRRTETLRDEGPLEMGAGSLLRHGDGKKYSEE